MEVRNIEIQFEEEDYQNLQKIAFSENKVFSTIIYEATIAYLNMKKNSENNDKKDFASDDEIELALRVSIEDFSDVYKKLAL